MTCSVGKILKQVQNDHTINVVFYSFMMTVWNKSPPSVSSCWIYFSILPVWNNMRNIYHWKRCKWIAALVRSWTKQNLRPTGLIFSFFRMTVWGKSFPSNRHAEAKFRTVVSRIARFEVAAAIAKQRQNRAWRNFKRVSGSDRHGVTWWTFIIENVASVMQRWSDSETSSEWPYD